MGLLMRIRMAQFNFAGLFYLVNCLFSGGPRP